jgi:hypothetical protein
MPDVGSDGKPVSGRETSSTDSWEAVLLCAVGTEECMTRAGSLGSPEEAFSDVVG